jgi:ATP-binding cassette subfamily F protein uup
MYLRRKEEALANEAAERAKFDDKLAEEEAWVRQGIKARRTRNEGRVRALEAMREERLARREQVGQVQLQSVIGDAQAPQSGKLVFELDEVSKSYGETPVVRHFSARITRGDRVGLIGPNGAGKTTLLKLLMGEISPDQGTVRRGANVEIAYYDQQREQLDPEQTLFATIGDGNDTVTVNGRVRHVNAYLRDFLFAPEQAASPVKALSGGERNRLLLARLFTRPANVLVLDEPTNDLDIETLELLEEQLLEWSGTLLLVSHDRAFMDNVVTTTFAFEGDGNVREYVGGYQDWLRQRPAPAPPPAASRTATLRPSVPAEGGAAAPATSKKLSYKEQRELEALPIEIESLEAEEQALNARIAGPEFYKEGGEAIDAALARLAVVTKQLGEALHPLARARIEVELTLRAY